MINQRLQVRLNIVWLHRARVTAVPPLLQFTDQADGEQGEHRCSRTRPWLEQLHRVRRASARREIWNKTSAHPPPAGLLAPPGQATAWPRQLFTVEQSTAWADHSKAVLPPWTGMEYCREPADREPLDGSRRLKSKSTSHTKRPKNKKPPP
jgi:hypothetical protein